MNLRCKVLVALSLSFSAPAVCAQTTAGKLLVAGTGPLVYLVDLDSGSAAPLSLTLDRDTSLSMSPGNDFLAAYGPKGVDVYKITGTTLGPPVKASAAATVRAVWANDNKTLVYLQETISASGAMTVSIYQWSVDTQTSKKLN